MKTLKKEKNRKSGDGMDNETSAARPRSGAENCSWSQRLERAIVARLLGMVLPDTHLVLDYGNRGRIEVGNVDHQSILIAPPSLPALLAIMSNPNYKLGNAFVAKRWDVRDDQLVVLIKALLKLRKRNALFKVVDAISSIKGPIYWLKQRFNLKMPNPVQRHYDEQVGFFKKMIGNDLIYTCAIFDSEEATLEEAQENKVKLVAKRLRLNSNSLNVLDVGCGWGGMAYRFAHEYDATVDAITISTTQFNHIVRKQNMPSEADRRLRVFNRSLQRHSAASPDKYDRIFSVGVFEHFGEVNQRRYFDWVSNLLSPGGFTFVHCVTSPKRRKPNPWIEHNIFPGHFVPTQAMVEKYARKSGLEVVEVVKIEPKHYARTLRMWRERLIQAYEVSKLTIDDEENLRRIKFYLASCEASFSDDTLGLHVCHYVFKRP